MWSLQRQRQLLLVPLTWLLLLLLPLPLPLPQPSLAQPQPGTLSPQGNALLQALGLRPPSGPPPTRPVPPVMWRLFRRGPQAAESHGARGEGPEMAQEPEPLPCHVKELGVPGNIVRHVLDGGAAASPEPALGALCLEKPLFFNLSFLEPREQLTLVRLELNFGAPGALSPGQGWELSVFPGHGSRLWGQPLLSHSVATLQEPLHFDLLGLGPPGNASFPQNLSLVLEILPGGKGSGLPRGLCAELGRSLEASLLVVTLDPQLCRHPVRKRRATHLAPLEGLDPPCKARQLYINFRDVGWHNWIIAPRGFMANYCQGHCFFPTATKISSFNHAVMQSLMHSVAPTTTPPPCCVPVKLSPISVLFYDNSDNVVLRHYEDMVVDECGCR
ncbi:embryonic growth/differentiation factor 1-like isoform X1 [Gracilinanus agilis]|uniref:embryonic growth/differentiation factor 1-like isoform X1 n=1 Tax=Gracilinanus agilis TaxID=191870 RepID=UPI001CFF0EE9|nr:embryonic growth/differentiation factor 1-like isoform X1 [Gracilinanus agilis]